MNTLGLGRYVETLGLGLPYYATLVVTVPGGGGGRRWSSYPRRDGVRLRRIDVPGEDFNQEALEQILREDDELLLFIISAVKIGAI